LAVLKDGLVVDGWMALVSGREIAQHGLPSHDALAVMTEGARWIDQQWLAQFALYGLSSLGGMKLTLLVHVALGVGALAGAAVLGAALVSLAGIVRLAQARRIAPGTLLLAVAPWACLFASPYALHLPAYYEKILVGGNFSRFVSEWAPTTLKAETAPVYLL